MRFLVLLALVWAATPALAEEFIKMDGPFVVLEGTNSGARSEALGDADITCGGGPGVLQLNPAALAAGDGVEAEYANLAYSEATGFDYAYDTLGASLAWQGWRAGVVHRSFTVDTRLPDTDDPAGPGTLLRWYQRMVVAVAGYEVGRLIAPDSSWQLGLGAAYRHYYLHDEELLSNLEGGQGSLDAGMTVGWCRRQPGPGLAVQAAVVRQNITDERILLGEYDASLPRIWRFGVGLQATTSLGRESGDGLRLHAAYTRSRHNGYQGNYGADHVGLEVVLLQLLAVRVGHDSSLFTGNTGYGAALILDQAWLDPVSLAVEWARIDLESETDDARDIYGLRGSVAF
jgi:hypothetical protein